VPKLKFEANDVLESTNKNMKTAVFRNLFIDLPKI